METADALLEARDLINRTWETEAIDDCSVARMISPMRQVRSGIFLGGAKTTDGQLVGALLAEQQYDRDERTKIYADYIAIDPQYAKSGIGSQLVNRLLDFARKESINLVTWTFDPMRPDVAYLYMQKFGAVLRELKYDSYKGSDSPLYFGLPTHRFGVLVRPNMAIEKLDEIVDRKASEGQMWRLPIRNDYVALARNADSRHVAADMQARFFDAAQDLIKSGFTAVRFERNAAGGDYIFIPTLSYKKLEAQYY